MSKSFSAWQRSHIFRFFFPPSRRARFASLTAFLCCFFNSFSLSVVETGGGDSGGTICWSRGSCDDDILEVELKKGRGGEKKHRGSLRWLRKVVNATLVARMAVVVVARVKGIDVVDVECERCKGSCVCVCVCT